MAQHADQRSANSTATSLHRLKPAAQPPSLACGASTWLNILLMTVLEGDDSSGAPPEELRSTCKMYPLCRQGLN